jgi:hypothetical protein
MGLSHEHKENIAGYFAYASGGDRWGPKHWGPPRQRTVTTMAEPDGEAEVEGGPELLAEARDWLAHVHDLARRRDTTPARPSADVNHDAHLRALRLAWESRGIPWNPTIAEGYLRYHPWDGLETR